MALFHVGFISYSLKREVDINVILPTCTIPESMGLSGEPTHKVKAPYPVLYLLHGMGNNYSVWGRYTSVERYAEERQICVVMMSGENRGYRDQENGDKHFQFISKELPEFIQNTFPVSTRPEDTYIAGLSMGSMGTLLHALSNPQNYRAAGSFSGPMMDMGKMFSAAPEERERLNALKAEDMKDMISPEAVKLVNKAKEEGKTFPDFYISTGLQDGPERAKAFAAFLAENGIRVTTDFSKNYGHEWQCWDENIKEFLDWLPRTDYYAGKKRKI